MAHIDRMREVISNVRQAGADISARKTAKKAKEEREVVRAKIAAEASSKSAAKALPRQDAHIAKQAEKKNIAERKREGEEHIGAIPSREWTMMSLDMTHHAQITTIESAEFSVEQVNPLLPYIVSGVDLAEPLRPHLATFNVWVAGFDRNDIVLSKHRAAWELDAAGDLRKAMLAYGPQSMEIIDDLSIVRPTAPTGRPTSRQTDRPMDRLTARRPTGRPADGLTN